MRRKLLWIRFGMREGNKKGRRRCTLRPTGRQIYWDLKMVIPRCCPGPQTLAQTLVRVESELLFLMRNRRCVANLKQDFRPHANGTIATFPGLRLVDNSENSCGLKSSPFSSSIWSNMYSGKMEPGHERLGQGRARFPSNRMLELLGADCRRYGNPG